MLIWMLLQLLFSMDRFATHIYFHLSEAPVLFWVSLINYFLSIVIKKFLSLFLNTLVFIKNCTSEVFSVRMIINCLTWNCCLLYCLLCKRIVTPSAILCTMYILCMLCSTFLAIFLALAFRVKEELYLDFYYLGPKAFELK